MSETMRAICKTKPEPGAELIDAPIPQVGPDDVLIKVRATTICGTDLHVFNWDPWAQSRIKTPLIFGHECAGDVVQIGNNVHDVQVGDYVSVETHIPVGVSYQTRICQANFDPLVKILGIDRPGSYAEYVAVPAKVAWKNPSDMAPEVASIQEPFGNGVYTVLSAPVTAKTVLITGCGPIGLWAVGIAKAAGAKAVYATDINPLRLKIAEQMGATIAINSAETDPVELMAEFRKVRAQGYALIDQELEIGLCSIAVPVENDRGQTVAALNIGAPAAHVPASEMVARYLPLLRETQATLRTVLR